MAQSLICRHNSLKLTLWSLLLYLFYDKLLAKNSVKKTRGGENKEGKENFIHVAKNKPKENLSYFYQQDTLLVNLNASCT